MDYLRVFNPTPEEVDEVINQASALISFTPKGYSSLTIKLLHAKIRFKVNGTEGFTVAFKITDDFKASLDHRFWFDTNGSFSFQATFTTTDMKLKILNPNKQVGTAVWYANMIWV